MAAKSLAWLMFMIVAPVVALATVGLMILAAPWAHIVQQGDTWSEMDWNRDGHTSIGEVVVSTEIGKREVFQDARECFEYFYFKDGLPVKVECP